MPPKQPVRRRTTKGRSAPRRRSRQPALNERQLDVLGIGLIALGVFFCFVIYGGWDGGKAGKGVVEGLKLMIGTVHNVIPLALMVAGLIVVFRSVFPSHSPIRSGALCLGGALTLAFAANVFGPDGTRPGDWNVEWVKPRGGMVGEAMYVATATLIGRVGAMILALFLFLAAVLLLTGASISSVLNRTRDSLSNTSQRMKQARDQIDTAKLKQATPVMAGLRAKAKAFKSESQEPGGFDEAQTEIFQPHDELTHRLDPSIDGESAMDWEKEIGLLDNMDGEIEARPGSKRTDGAEGVDAPDSSQLTIGAEDLTPQGRLRSSVTDAPDFPWKLPKRSLLKRSGAAAQRPDVGDQQRKSAQLVEALGHFGVKAQIVGLVTGPHITRYELRLAPGTKVAKVAQLKDDLAYALAASDIRILAPIPGKQAVGVEVPNASRRIVQLGDVFQDKHGDWSPLTVWLGKDVSGRPIPADLAKMPHLLVAGTTGAGKSGCVNAMLASILLRATPHEVRMVLVDPKQVELNHYESIPHLLTPVITSPRQAATALQNLVKEMEVRYGQMSLARTRGLPELNKVRESRGEPPLPYILCVIDELADLMMVAPADVEDSIIRLAQKARAVGIHLVLATQSPRVDVITGMIKANVPSRIAFAVSSQTDSRVILDQNGAEALLGQGDMLFAPVGSSRLERIQGAYIDEEQIAALTDSWRRQGEPEFHEELLVEVQQESDQSESGDGFDPDQDSLLDDAIRLVVEMQTASTSMMQRRMRVGYTRAGRLIDMLERRGVISGYEGSKPRQVLVTEADLPRVLSNLAEREQMKSGSGSDVGGGAEGQQALPPAEEAQELQPR